MLFCCRETAFAVGKCCLAIGKMLCCCRETASCYWENAVLLQGNCICCGKLLFCYRENAVLLQGNCICCGKVLCCCRETKLLQFSSQAPLQTPEVRGSIRPGCCSWAGGGGGKCVLMSPTPLRHSAWQTPHDEISIVHDEISTFQKKRAFPRLGDPPRRNKHFSRRNKHFSEKASFPRLGAK